MSSSNSHVNITRREKTVIDGILGGKRNKIIGYELGLSENTVKVYLSRIYAKTGTSDRLSLANWARSLADAERLAEQRFQQLSEQHSQEDAGAGIEPVPQPVAEALAFRDRQLARYDVLRTLVQTVPMTTEQWMELFLVVSNRNPDIKQQRKLRGDIPLRGGNLPQ